MSESIVHIQEERDQPTRAKNAFNIILAMGVVFALIAIGTVLFTKSFHLDLNLMLISLTSGISFYSLSLSRKGKSDFGIILISASLLLTIIGRIFVVKGLAIPTGIIGIILISTFAIYALPTKWMGRIIIATFLIIIGAIIGDQYTTGIPISAALDMGMNIALTLGAIYVFMLAGQFQRFSLRIKLIVMFLLLSTVPLVIMGWQTYTSSRDILEKQISVGLSESANNSSSHFEDFIQTRFTTLTTEARLKDIIEFISIPRSERKLSLEYEHALNALKTFALQEQNFVVSYALLDESGLNALDTIPSNVNSTYADEPFFFEPFSSGKPYISTVQFPKKFANPVLYISVPIFAEENKIVGVMVVTYNANILQSILQTSVQNRSSGTEYTYVVDDANFIVLGHSSKPNMIYKSLLEIDDTDLLKLQLENLAPNGLAPDVTIPQPEIIDNIKDIDVQSAFEASSYEYDGEIASVAAKRVQNAGWIVVTAQPISAISVLTQNQTRATVTSSALLSILAALIALAVSNFFTTPIVQLTSVAEKISDGDFTQKAVIRSNDEIGILGNTFNKMSEEIQELIGNLEKRVEERTAEMEKATQQSEKRANELQIISEIARYISTEKDLQNLLPLITRTVSERFGFYHVGIFLLNENRKFAVLRAANSAGGQRMLERQHKLEVGQTGIVGNVTASGVARIALDTGTDAVYFNNPDLPETHSEMALPLIVRGDVIGALDVQSTVSNAFSTSDISILSLLADQIAIAIDNARLLEESKKALAESEALFRGYVSDAWQSKSSSNIMGYYQTISDGKPVTRKDAKLLEDETPVNLSVPITLRNQAIGTMNIRMSNQNEQLTTEQINIIESVSERLGLALENARLFEETSTRATREKLVTDITTKIRSTNDPQEMIKTAVEELKRALGAKRIEVVSKKSSFQ